MTANYTPPRDPPRTRYQRSETVAIIGNNSITVDRARVRKEMISLLSLGICGINVLMMTTSSRELLTT